MSKKIAVQKIISEMKVGDLVRFPTGKEDEFIEVERIFISRDPAWVVYYSGDRLVIKELSEITRFIAKRWNQDLKKIMEERYSDLDEIIDLGDF